MTNLSGAVSAQAAPAETVTITITKPDGSTDTVTASTDATGAYTTTYNATAPGSYSAVAHIDADAQFTSADSAPASFSVLTPRTVTLSAA